MPEDLKNTLNMDPWTDGPMDRWTKIQCLLARPQCSHAAWNSPPSCRDVRVQLQKMAQGLLMSPGVSWCLLMSPDVSWVPRSVRSVRSVSMSLLRNNLRFFFSHFLG